MTRMIRVRSGKFAFFLDGKRIYIKVEGSLNQQYLVDTFDRAKMTDNDYIHLVDAIYRKRIINTASFNDHLYSKFRLVTTQRKL